MQNLWLICSVLYFLVLCRKFWSSEPEVCCGFFGRVMLQNTKYFYSLIKYLFVQINDVAESCRQSSSCSLAFHRALTRPIAVSVVHRWVVRHHLECRTRRTLTTHICTSVLQSHSRRFQCNVSSPALNASMPGCIAKGWGWTPTRHSSCGLEHDSSLPSWSLPSYHYCLSSSSRRPQCSTWASTSTASLPCLTTSPRYARACFNYASYG